MSIESAGLIVTPIKDNVVEITAKQGVDWVLTVTLTDQNDVPVDLTGFDAKSQLREKYADSTVVAAFACTVEPATGTITMSMSAATNMQIDVKKNRQLVFDLIVSDGITTPYAPIEGVINIKPGVTEWT